MRSNRFGCLSGTGMVAAFVTALVIAGYAYAQGGLLYNPGPLNAQSGEMLGGVTSHAETGGNCKACHTAPWEAARMEDRCVDCHGDIALQMQDVATLHGSIMTDQRDLRCRFCHPEHRGADAKLTELGDATFPHEAVGFSLKGHQFKVTREAFVCSDCHTGDISKFDLQTCDACHRQADLGFMTAHTLSFGSACLDCHDGVDSLVTDFDHNQFSFKLLGKHAALECVECHVNARGLGDFALTLQDCHSCHFNDEPHEGRFGRDCAVCHGTLAWTPAQFNGPHVFPLNHGDGGTSCVTCHPASFSSYTCYGCHEHNEMNVRSEHLEEGISNFQNCMECHPDGREHEGGDGGDD